MTSSILKFFQLHLSTIVHAESSEAFQSRTIPCVTRGTYYELARKGGVVAFDIQCHTTAIDCYRSKMYTRCISLTDEDSLWINTNTELFTKEEMDDGKTLANKVNLARQAERASIFLRKAAGL